MSKVNGVRESICPFCTKKIIDRLTGDDDDVNCVHYYFDNSAYKLFDGFQVPAVAMNQAGGKFRRFWQDVYGRDDVSGGDGVIVSELDLIPISECYIDGQHNGEYVINPSQGSITSDEDVLIFYPPNPDNFDQSHMMQFVCRAARKIAKALVCPHCNNLLPTEFFQYPKLMLVTAGASKVGKTVYLVSILTNSFIQIKEALMRLYPGTGPDDIQVSCLLSGSEQYTAELYKTIVPNFEQRGILPPNTRHPLPPLFLKIEIKKAGTEFILCIVDTEGERWEDTSKPSYDMLLAKCNGILYFVEPGQCNLSYSENEPSEPADDQESYDSTTPIGTVSRGGVDFMNPSLMGGGRSSRMQPNDEKAQDATMSAAGVLRFLIESDSIIEDKYCAFVLTKYDRFLDDQRYKSVLHASKIPYLYTLDNFVYSRPGSQRLLGSDLAKRIDREAPMRQIAAASIMQEYFPQLPATHNIPFKDAGWFAVSCFRGQAVPDEMAEDTSGDKRGEAGKQNSNNGRVPQNQRYTLNLYEPLQWIFRKVIPDVDD